jgi:uncharacterized protein
LSLSLHSVMVQGTVRGLRNMLVWMERAQAHADAKKFDSANYLALRLAPDMLVFSSQVMIACEIAKLGAAKLLGEMAPPLAQKDATLADLRVRIEQAIAYLEGLDAARIDAASAPVVVERRGQSALDMGCKEYVQTWSQPNFFFHLTTTYALLRHAGVDLGKADYLGIY